MAKRNGQPKKGKRFGRPPARRPQPQRRRARRPGPSRSGASGRELWHPAFHGNSWVPKSLALTPSVRVRDQTLVVLLSGLNGVSMLIQPYVTTAAGQTTFAANIMARSGTAVQAGVGGTVYNGNVISAIPNGRIRLHRMAITLTCLGPTAAGVLLPSSVARFGALRSPIDANNFAVWGDLINHLATKAEMHTASSYSLMTKPAHVCSFPVDVRAWESFTEISTLAALPNIEPDDTLSTIAITISANATLDQFAVVCHCDYDVLPADDVFGAGLIASAAVHHQPVQQSLLDRAIAGASEVAGVFEKGVELASSVGNVVGRVQRAISTLPRALPALDMGGRNVLSLPY